MNPSVTVTIPPIVKQDDNKEQQNNNNEVEADNPWDLVPGQTKIKAHSRSNSKHETLVESKGDSLETNQGDKWLASLTDKISAVEVSPSRGWSTNIAPPPANNTTEDPLDNEWTALANRNEAKHNKNNNNPFVAFV